MNTNEIIEEELLELLAHFESFFNRVGFKRIDGAIFGLLSFSKRPLTSEEIEQTLALSQSAVSLSLKTLGQYSMIESIDVREQKRLKLHKAKDDALKVVSNIIKRRDLEYLREFEKMNTRALNIIQDETRQRRVKTILSTTRFAKSISEILVKVNDEFDNAHPVIERMPQFLNFISSNIPGLGQAKDQILQNKITNKVKDTVFGKLNDILTSTGDMK